MTRKALRTVVYCYLGDKAKAYRFVCKNNCTDLYIHELFTVMREIKNESEEN